MNSDSESLQNQLLAWLLGDPQTTEERNLVDCKDVKGVNNLDETAAASNGGDFRSRQPPQTFQLGEIPTVQERFQAVLKRRLQIQIENHPPLFPWENQLTDYPDYVDKPSVDLVPVWGWTAQQVKLNLPILLPERVFQMLLEKCQGLVSSSLPLGTKLVQAVENLFPAEPEVINDIAGLVLRSPYRSAVDAIETMPNLESSYSDLQPRQQMALSLMAAKQLLENLTLPIGATDPLVERQWLTSSGVLTLRVEYQTQGQVTKLRVQSELPGAGILNLHGEASQAMVESSSPGCVSVELNDIQLNQTYTLEVELKEIDTRPLVFVIVPTA